MLRVLLERSSTRLASACTYNGQTSHSEEEAIKFHAAPSRYQPADRRSTRPLPAGRLIRAAADWMNFLCHWHKCHVERFYFYRRPVQSVKQPLGGEETNAWNEMDDGQEWWKEMKKKDARHMAMERDCRDRGGIRIHLSFVSGIRSSQYKKERGKRISPQKSSWASKSQPSQYKTRRGASRLLLHCWPP